MSDIKIIEIFDNVSQTTMEHVIIDRGNGEFTSMPKSVYDEQLAQSKEITTPKVDESKTK